MTARRRRGLSESEQTPVILASEESYSGQNYWLNRNQISSSVAYARNDLEIGEYPIEDKLLTRKENNTHIMTSRDRTTEFMNAIRSLQGRHVVRAVAARDPRKAKYIQSYAEFMMIARYVF